LGKRSARKAGRGSAGIHPLFADPEPARPGDPGVGAGRYVRNVRPKSANQAALVEALETARVVIALGPAGTGKTFLAIAKAVEALEAGTVRRIVLCRPAVEAGESLGYLPGDLHAKLAPYLRPITDALGERLGAKRLRALIADGTVEVAPIAYMRGRTLNHAAIIIDEAQNCTFGQLKMLLTRLGWQSTMVLTGDPDQNDLLPGLSGLNEIAGRLDGMAGAAVIRMTDSDVVRHPMVAAMLSVL
jgi:phosphate starvation-inducible protein PhoH and related proteins